MYFQLISPLHLLVVDIFTQLMQKDSLEKLGGKPKSITHLNWSRSLINVVPIQTESCLKTTTFVDINYHVREDFLWNRWKTMVSLIDWKNCVISCFFKSVDGIFGFAWSEDSCHIMWKCGNCYIISKWLSDYCKKMAQCSFFQVLGVSHFVWYEWIYMFT